MAKTSPTQLTLKKLRDMNYTATVTERWNSFAKIRQDLFGFIDVLAMKPNEMLAIQCTSEHNLMTRVNKMLTLEEVKKWIHARGSLEVWGWAKKGNRWQVKRMLIGFNDSDQLVYGELTEEG